MKREQQQKEAVDQDKPAGWSGRSWLSMEGGAVVVVSQVVEAALEVAADGMAAVVMAVVVES
ncbi:hypothetical protein V7S43_013129 [Phytophthora oleae]|uniref:Uncharacterized protein n=1 Tax=Phytophthora oleae TaxID=2107226 RepID=A0ABD3F773_9STRA